MALLQHLIVIGSSAGGPRILKDLFTGMPRLNAGILLVQHMPQFINSHFTSSLDKVTDMSVKIAEDKEYIEPGNVYVAPSGIHMIAPTNRQIFLRGQEKVNFVCPAVDITMLSLSIPRTLSLTGIILTGMGKDGAQGIIHMKSLGATTIAQDEKTSIIYGMPQEARKTGLIDFILPTESIAQKMIDIAS